MSWRAGRLLRATVKAVRSGGRKGLFSARVALGRYGIYLTENDRRFSRLESIHAGRRCFIIGNGPSLRRQDLAPLRDEITFVTNFFPVHPQHTLPAPPSEWMKRCWDRDGLAFKAYEKMNAELRRKGCRIYNATAGGRLEVFPRVPYEDLVPNDPMS